MKFLSPRYDAVFKKLFDEKHIHLLADFLMSLLELPAYV